MTWYATSYPPFLPETVVCEEFKFINKISNTKPSDRTLHRFKGSVLAIITGGLNPETLFFVEQSIVSILKEQMEKKRLTLRGIFKVLKLTFVQLDMDCFKQKNKEKRLSWWLFLIEKNLFVANIGHGRAFLISEQVPNNALHPPPII